MNYNLKRSLQFCMTAYYIEYYQTHGKQFEVQSQLVLMTGKKFNSLNLAQAADFTSMRSAAFCLQFIEQKQFLNEMRISRRKFLKLRTPYALRLLALILLFEPSIDPFENPQIKLFIISSKCLRIVRRALMMRFRTMFSSLVKYHHRSIFIYRYTLRRVL